MPGEIGGIQLFGMYFIKKFGKELVVTNHKSKIGR